MIVRSILLIVVLLSAGCGQPEPSPHPQSHGEPAPIVAPKPAPQVETLSVGSRFAQRSGVLRMKFPQTVSYDHGAVWVGEEFATGFPDAFYGFKPDPAEPGGIRRRMLWQPPESSLTGENPTAIMRLHRSDGGACLALSLAHTVSIVDVGVQKVVHTSDDEIGENSRRHFVHGRTNLLLSAIRGNREQNDWYRLSARMFSKQKQIVSSHGLGREGTDAIAISRNGRRCVAATRGGKITLLTVPELALEGECVIDEMFVSRLHFLRGDSLLACVGLTSIVLCDLDALSAVGRWEARLVEPGHEIVASAASDTELFLAMKPSGRSPESEAEVFALAIDERASINESQLTTLCHHSAQFDLDTMAVSANNNWLASVARGKEETEIILLPLTDER